MRLLRVGFFCLFLIASAKVMATQAFTKPQRGVEGEAPRALLAEGATRAPIIETEVPVYSLQDCLRFALQKNDLIRSRVEGIEAARWRRNEADARFWPVLQYEYNAAPVPQDVSNAFNEFFTGNLSMFNRFKIGLGIPIYTFGQLETVQKMADKGVEAATQEKFKEDAKVASDVRQLYYGIQLGQELERLLESAVEELRKKITEEEQKSEHSPMDLMKMEMVLLELEKQMMDTGENRALAEQGMRVQMGLPDDFQFELDSNRLRPLPALLGEMEEYFAVAMDSRPEARLVKIGTEVKRFQYELEKKKWFPTMGVGGFFELGRTTSEISGVTSTDDFSDPFNFTRAGIGLEIKGQIDFHGQRARAKRAGSEYYKALLEKVMAERGLRLDVEKTYREAKRAEKNVDGLEEKQRLARRMMFLAKSNYDVGLGEKNEFIESLKLLLVSRAEYLKSVFDYNSILARLDEKIGVVPDVEELEKSKGPTKVIVPQGEEIYKGLNVGPPTNVVQALDRRLGEYKIGKHLSEENREFNRTLKHGILQELFDIRELAQRAMGQYWKERTDLEQKEFVDLLTAILEETSVSAKENSAKRGERADFDVEYMGDRPLNLQKGLAFSATVVHLLKENLDIKIHYELKRLGETWRIYDVIVDGASLVQNYRYSFQTIIKGHGYPELLRRLRNKLNELRAPKEKENE